MKEYYQSKGGKRGRFALRENTYRRIWYLIADYPYFKAVQRGHVDAEKFSKNNSIPNNGQSSAGVIGREFRVSETVFSYDLELEQCERYIKAIEDAQSKVPEMYVEYIMSHIVERKKYKEMREISERTLKIWVQRFIWHVAHNLGDA